jgi:hypothetical protein
VTQALLSSVAIPNVSVRPVRANNWLGLISIHTAKVRAHKYALKKCNATVSDKVTTAAKRDLRCET